MANNRGGGKKHTPTFPWSAAGQPPGRSGLIVARNEGFPLFHKCFFRSWAGIGAGGRAGGKNTHHFRWRVGGKTLTHFRPGCFSTSREKHVHMNPFFLPGEKNGYPILVINSKSWKSQFLSGEKKWVPLFGRGLGQAGQAKTAI